MKFIVFLLLFTFSLTAQDAVNVYTKQNGPNVSILADNDEVIPMTVKLELDIIGMQTTSGKKVEWIVVPAKTKKHLLTKATPKPGSREMTFAMQNTVLIGDVTLSADNNYNYQLPIAKGKNVEIYQGYNGRFSHSGENALDFGLNVGEKVFAARGGIVYNIEESNSKACSEESCSKYNNYIQVYHEDGTTAEYVHLKQNGVEVKVGDKVTAGELIGYSGNTGWTSGPHLHFMVYQITKDAERKSLKTKFTVKDEKGNDKSGVTLKEKKFYKK